MWQRAGQEAGKGRLRPEQPGRGLSARAVRWGMAGVLLTAGGWTWIGIRVLTTVPPSPHSLSPPGCTTLAIDRATGSTTAGPCPSRTPLREAQAAGAGGPIP